MLRRLSAPLVIALAAIVVACNPYSSQESATPIGVVLMNARTKGTGYTTYPKVNFYTVGSATFTFSSVNSDTCVVAPYDPTAVPTNNAKRIGAGAFMLMSFAADTDTLRMATTTDRTYAPATTAGVAFNPGDSVAFRIAGDVAGFPALRASAMTAEPFTITTPTIPPANQPMAINWTPANDNNAAMYISLLYNSSAGAGTGLNTQIFCDFHDDGQGTVQANLIPPLSASSVPWTMLAQRVRSNLIVTPVTAANGYVNIISTFEVPTPVSP